MDTRLKLIRSISWNEVFLMWEKQEAGLPHWIEHYKDRGFNSWKDWRKDSIRDLYLDKLEWNLYEILEPTKTIPRFHAGPFRAWIKKYYKDKNTITFEELAKNSEIKNKVKIDEISEKFPMNSVLIGLINNNNLIVVEGLHRCCTLAVAEEKKIDVNIKLFIACSEFSGELPLLGQENSPT